jgi:hypothetical protein
MPDSQLLLMAMHLRSRAEELLTRAETFHDADAQRKLRKNRCRLRELGGSAQTTRCRRALRPSHVACGAPGACRASGRLEIDAPASAVRRGDWKIVIRSIWQPGAISGFAAVEILPLFAAARGPGACSHIAPEWRRAPCQRPACEGIALSSRPAYPTCITGNDPMGVGG